MSRSPRSTGLYGAGRTGALAVAATATACGGIDVLTFTGTDGRYLDSSALRRRYRTAQKQAGLEPLRFHDLRHTFGSLAITQAEGLRELQDWMGHADSRTTARYVHYKTAEGRGASPQRSLSARNPRRRFRHHI